MRRDPRAYLWDMREAAALVVSFVAGLTFAEYVADDLRRSAVERQVQNIGEALAQLWKIEPTLAGKIADYDKIVGFRNVLVHGYAVLDHVRVWDTIQEDLPALQVQQENLLKAGDLSHPT